MHKAKASRKECVVGILGPYATGVKSKKKAARANNEAKTCATAMQRTDQKEKS